MSYQRGTRRKRIDWKGLADLAFVTIGMTIVTLLLLSRLL